jgi:PAS domain S-box-containing protein
MERLAYERRINAEALDAVGTLVVILDARGRVVRFNRACERLTGYASTEIVGHPVWKRVVPAAEIPEVRRVYWGSAEALTGSCENHWLSRDGRVRLIRWENARLSSGTGHAPRVIATAVDVTETARRAEAMRGIEAVGRMLADQGPARAALGAVLNELEARMGYDLLALHLCDGPALRLGAQRVAIHDGLTGLYNRRHFDAELDHAVARYRRRPGASLAAIIFDLDRFGDFNRAHGLFRRVRLDGARQPTRLRRFDAEPSLRDRYAGTAFPRRALRASSTNGRRRVATSVRVRRNASSLASAVPPTSAGSSRPQWSVLCSPGKTGQSWRARSQTVMT